MSWLAISGKLPFLLGLTNGLFSSKDFAAFLTALKVASVEPSANPSGGSGNGGATTTPLDSGSAPLISGLFGWWLVKSILAVPLVALSD